LEIAHGTVTVVASVNAETRAMKKDFRRMYTDHKHIGKESFLAICEEINLRLYA
jgi:hypothetical protein